MVTKLDTLELRSPIVDRPVRERGTSYCHHLKCKVSACQPQPAMGMYPDGGPPAYQQPQPPPFVQQPQQQPQQQLGISVIQMASQHQQVIVATYFRDNPVQTVCPYCNAQVVTLVDYEVGTCAWLWCCGICTVITILGTPLGCCFIPFCMDSCKDATHYCPQCHAEIAHWNR